MTDENENVVVSRSVEHTIMFWFLTAIAILLFIPSVLMPLWIETEEIRQHEQVVTERVAGLESQVEKNDKRIHALLADPLVNERIIRRELNYRPEQEKVIQLPDVTLLSARANLPENPAPCSEADTSEPIVPAWLMSMTRWLPDWPWRTLFAESPNRYIILLMAGGLLLSAFLLYGPARIGGPNDSRQKYEAAEEV